MVEEKNKVEKKKYPYLFSGTEILKMELPPVQYLWKPYMDKQIMSALTGSSDVGKSSFLRQLAIAVALKKTEFLNHELNVEHGRVIYYTTEDSRRSINRMLKKQLPALDPNELSGLCYIFNTERPFQLIEEQLKAEKTDLVIIDCFADIFDGQMNDIVSMRKFLNKYDKLCMEYDCNIIFLHHNGKRTEDKNPSKSNIIGSQGFEGTMRLVMDLRKTGANVFRQLWFVKGNYISEELKSQALELEFNDKQEFEFTGNKSKMKTKVLNNRRFSAEEKEKIMSEVKKFSDDDLSIDKLMVKLKEVYREKLPGRVTLSKWLKEDDPVQPDDIPIDSDE